jgi:transposase
MNLLDNKRRTQVIAALVEGNSIRATSRMFGVSQNTIFKLLADLGTACGLAVKRSVRDAVPTIIPSQ